MTIQSGVGCFNNSYGTPGFHEKTVEIAGLVDWSQDFLKRE